MSAGGDTYARVEASATVLRARCGKPPTIAIVLGSGLGDALGRRLTSPVEIDYGEVPHWPPAGVAGHAGRLLVGDLAGRRVAVLSGRAHVYEGHDVGAVVLPVQAMARLGVRQVVLTNAAGAVSRRVTPGSLMLIDDHISLMGVNPLAGANDERLGPRFPDMSEVYSARLREMARTVSETIGVPLSRGVYLAVAGPSYETPAEIRFFRAIGADAVGMSTVPDAIAARQMGVEVLGISCLTNLAAGMSGHTVRHEDVLDTSRRLSEALGELLEGVVRRL